MPPYKHLGKDSRLTTELNLSQNVTLRTVDKDRSNVKKDIADENFRQKSTSNCRDETLDAIYSTNDAPANESFEKHSFCAQATLQPGLSSNLDFPERCPDSKDDSNSPVGLCQQQSLPKQQHLWKTNGAAQPKAVLKIT